MTFCKLWMWAATQLGITLCVLICYHIKRCLIRWCLSDYHCYLLLYFVSSYVVWVYYHYYYKLWSFVCCSVVQMFSAFPMSPLSILVPYPPHICILGSASRAILIAVPSKTTRWCPPSYKLLYSPIYVKIIICLSYTNLLWHSYVYQLGQLLVAHPT